MGGPRARLPSSPPLLTLLVVPEVWPPSSFLRLRLCWEGFPPESVPWQRPRVPCYLGVSLHLIWPVGWYLQSPAAEPPATGTSRLFLQRKMGLCRILCLHQGLSFICHAHQCMLSHRPRTVKSNQVSPSQAGSKAKGSK